MDGDALITSVRTLLTSIDAFLYFLSAFGASRDIREEIYDVLYALDDISIDLRWLIRRQTLDLEKGAGFTLVQKQTVVVHNLPQKCQRASVDLSKLAGSTKPAVSLHLQRWPSRSSAQYSIRVLGSHKRTLSQCLRVIKSMPSLDLLLPRDVEGHRAGTSDSLSQGLHAEEPALDTLHVDYFNTFNLAGEEDELETTLEFSRPYQRTVQASERHMSINSEDSAYGGSRARSKSIFQEQISIG